MLSQPQTGLYLVWHVISFGLSSHSQGLMLLLVIFPTDLQEVLTPSIKVKMIKK